MTTYYLDTAGSNTSTYDTWAKAATAISTLSALDAAGDIIWLASGHAESQTSYSLNWAGTTASPIRISCGTTAAAPPTTSAVTGQFTATSGTISLNVGSSGVVIFEGAKFVIPDANSFGHVSICASSGGFTTMRDCTYTFGNGSFMRLDAATNFGAGSLLQNNTVKFGHTGQSIGMSSGGGNTRIEGLTIDAASSAITTLFDLTADGMYIEMSGCDLSAGAAAMNITANTKTSVRCTLTACKMPGSWSGSMNSSTPGANSVYSLENCDSGDTHYNYMRKTSAGIAVDETTLVMTGGAADRDATALAIRVDTSSGASALLPFYSEEMVIDNLTVGSSVTVTVPFLHDSATNMTNAEIYVEVMLFTTSGVPLGTWYRDDVKTDNSGNRLASAADQASSSETWTTTGMSNPNKQECSVSATIQEAGYIVSRLVICKASKTLYYNFPPTIS